ncbi:hypothetical protein BSTP3_080 [Bacillus phage BSTP3]|nr:hypothetical protein BSTP3_080 [Bacillus phage BSTP3]
MTKCQHLFIKNLVKSGKPSTNPRQYMNRESLMSYQETIP